MERLLIYENHLSDGFYSAHLFHDCMPRPTIHATNRLATKGKRLARIASGLQVFMSFLGDYKMK